MRKHLIGMVVAICLGAGLAVTAFADEPIDWHAQERQLKQSQRSERVAMKLKEHQIRQSLKASPVSGATRAEIIHKMQREHRELIQKQRDAIQKLKDQERAYREYQRTNGG